MAGHPVLELANTLSHRRDAALAEDRIAEPDDLSDWARSLGLDGECANVERDDVARVTVVREAVHDVFAAVAEAQPRPRQAIALLLRHAAAGFEGEAPPRLDALLAWHALQGLATLPAQRVGSCPACGWLFLDSSKAARRRWCAMATCGTVAKVRRFRARRKDER